MLFPVTLMLAFPLWQAAPLSGAFEGGKAAQAVRPEEAATVDANAARRRFRLGPDDQVSIWVQEAEEFNGKLFRVDGSGELNLPFMGRVAVGGSTIEELEGNLVALLKKYFREPQVIVSVNEFRSQPVSVIGAVKSPGIYQLQGSKTLIEVLSLAGGLSPEAGHVVKITRRLSSGPLPLPTAVVDGGFSVGEANLKTIMEARDPVQNIRIAPEDVISVPQATMVYVIGEVAKQGGVPLNERETISALEALATAGGALRTATPQYAKILRPILGGPKRAELDLDLKKIMAGQASDVPLLPNDVLFIPGSASKRTAGRVLDALIQTGIYAGTVQAVR